MLSSLVKRQELSQRKTIIGLSGNCRQRSERDQCLAQLPVTEELTQKRALLEAEVNATEATKRAGLGPRELVDRLVAQTSLVGQKDAELVKMQAKLDELELFRDQHVRALEQAQRARAADADEYETELAKVRPELEAKKSELGGRKSELEAIRLRLTNVEIGWAKSKTEADCVP